MTLKKVAGPVFCAVLALVLTAVMAFGWLDTLDNRVCDALYQESGTGSSEILVVEIDEETLAAIGNLPWPRSYIAAAIENLNRDPENRPAVIGIDLTFNVANSYDREGDQRLVDAVKEGGNVVVASYATIGSQLVETADGFSLKTGTATGWSGPFEALAETGKVTGAANAMYDTQDHILRHALLYVDVPEALAGDGIFPQEEALGTPEEGYVRAGSFDRVVYEKYCLQRGIKCLDPPAVSAEGAFYLPFTANERGYTSGINFLDLLDGTLNAYYYRNKIVLIGGTAADLKDMVPTALDHKDMSGVNVHANTIEAFMKGFFPREASRPLQLALVFGISLLLALFFRKRSVLSSLLGLAVSAGGWVLVCKLLYAQGIVLHALWVPVCAAVLFVVSALLNYRRTQLEKREITNTFGHYIDPAVLEQLLEEGKDSLSLGGKSREIAVLFVDVRGFTSMSEALPPETVVEIVNRYLTLTTDCIMRNHGTLDKFVGDCTMAVWNAPVSQEDPVYLAAKAAMDMVEGSVKLGQELEAAYGRSVSFGIGINYGPAVVGNIGAPKRMDYTAIGDTVNTAARLEANAPGGTILISRAVADALGDRASVTSLGGSIPLKGKQEGFEVLRLVALS